MQVIIIPVLEDNYSYLLIDKSTNTAAAVDPVEPDKVIAAAKELGVTITTVLTTHSHSDHSGGNNEMKKKIEGVIVVGGAGDRVEGANVEVKQGDTVKVGSLTVTVLSTPCHTPGHVCFFVKHPQGGERDSKEEGKEDSYHPVVFTGDTMFVGGCGNFNKGTPQQMANNMLNVLGSLPGNTLVYVGHEYTMKNYAFGLFAEPDNKELHTKHIWATEQRKKNLPTVPSTIKDEWATNPFMRVREPSIQKFTGEKDESKGILAVRRAKDEWGRKPKI